MDTNTAREADGLDEIGGWHDSHRRGPVFRARVSLGTSVEPSDLLYRVKPMTAPPPGMGPAMRALEAALEAALDTGAKSLGCSARRWWLPD
jgi:hypothetical protein